MKEESAIKFEPQKAHSTERKPFTVPGFKGELFEQFSSRAGEHYKEIQLPGGPVPAWSEGTVELNVSVSTDSRHVGTLKYGLSVSKVSNVPGMRAEDTHELLKQEFDQRLKQDLQTLVDGGHPEALEERVFTTP